jgi:hypothetical protein
MHKKLPLMQLFYLAGILGRVQVGGHKRGEDAHHDANSTAI